MPDTQRQPNLANVDEARRYHRPTGNVTPSLPLLGRHVRTQSPTPILVSDRALLAVGPSTNRSRITALLSRIVGQRTCKRWRQLNTLDMAP
jgi:hypothetical protein